MSEIPIARSVVYVPGHQFGVVETVDVVTGLIDAGDEWLELTTLDRSADGPIRVRASHVSAVMPR